MWVAGKSDFNENPVVSLDLDLDLDFGLRLRACQKKPPNNKLYCFVGSRLIIKDFFTFHPTPNPLNSNMNVGIV